MSKRRRSLSVQFGDHDIEITKHAINRFRNRVKNMPDRLVPAEVSRMLLHCEPIRSSDPRGRTYLSHPLCVFVLTAKGAIVTVLPPYRFDRRLSSSLKEERRNKKLLAKYVKNSRARRLAFKRHRDRSPANERHQDE